MASLDEPIEDPKLTTAEDDGGERESSVDEDDSAENSTSEMTSAELDEIRDPTDLGQEISADELGIDLDSLKLSSPNMLGKAKPKPTLTDSSDKRPVGRPAREDEGLFAWCEQFSYTPGVDYLKLHRLYPKTWEGMSIGGFIEEVYEPIDEHWLADRWGGGSFQIEAYQRDSTGRSRKSQVKHTEISGLPKAFMGSDGRPHDLPEGRMSASASSRRSSDVLRRRMGLGRMRTRGSEDRFSSDFEDENTESFPRSSARTSNVDQPLADAGTLYKVLQESKKSDNDALGVLRDAQKDVHNQMQATAQQQAEMYRTLLDQQKDEMRRIREESKSAAENSSAPFKELLQFMAVQGSDSSSKTNLEALRNAHETAVQSLTKEHSAHIEGLRRTYDDRQRDLMDELNRLRSSYSQDIERIRQDYLEKEKISKDDAFRNFQTQIQIIQAQNADLRERHRDELSAITRDKNEMIAGLRSDLTELRASALQREHDSRISIAEKEATLRLEYDKREKDLRDRIRDLEASSKTSILEERARLKEEFEERYSAKLTALQESHQSRLDNITQTSELKVTSAEKDARNSVEIAKKELRASYESQITRLETTIESLKADFSNREQLSLERSKLEQEAANKDRENQRLILESTAQSREALAEMSRKQLEARIKDLTKDLERSKAEQATLSQQVVPASNDPFEQLERLNEIKTRLKAHGFIDSHEPKDQDAEPEPEEKPKDFLGKILHYGPQFIGPILQRVDAATAVAQQAVHQQQLSQDSLKTREQVVEQQRLLEQERAAATAREASLRERREMLLRKRQEREMRSSEEAEYHAQMETAQREQLASQLLSLREAQEPEDILEQAPLSDASLSGEPSTPSPETTDIFTGDNNMASDQDGYTQLAEYLEKSISERKSASGIINELKMALMMGMFSRDTLNEILAEDFDTLATRLSDIRPSLRSPKSRKILKTVMEGMRK